MTQITHPLLTQSPPYKSKQQREQDVAPVPLVFCCYGDDPQEKEDQGLRDGAEHLHNMPDSCAGTLGNIFLHVVLHSEGTGNNTAEKKNTHTHSYVFAAFFKQSAIPQSEI